MTRHLRNREVLTDNDDDNFKDEQGIVHTTTRSLRKINYAEIENMFDDDEELGFENPKEQNGVTLNNNDGSIPDNNNTINNAYNNNYPNDIPTDEGQESSQTPSKKRKNVGHKDDDDESFHEDENDDMDDDMDDEDDEDEYINHRGRRSLNARRQKNLDRNFVVPDIDEQDMDNVNMNDYDDEDYQYYSNRRSSRRKRVHRTKSIETTPPPAHNTRSLRSTRSSVRQTRRSVHMDDDEDDEVEYNESRKHLTLADEIRELQDDSPIREKRSLRERTKPVNYTLPPPLTAATAEEYLRQNGNFNKSFNGNSPSRRGRPPVSLGPTRRLFPTGGPFGGNDVVTVFGQNTNYYSVSKFLTNTSNNNAPPNKLILDSDSSEDEILALGDKPKAKPLLAKKKKKKPEIADLDPLGVDMNINFDDIGGLDNYIDQLKEMVTLPLLYPELYQNFNIIPPRGVLFHGPPGTGKTLMARALAASCSTESRKITFFMRKGADILSKWVGEAERQLRLLFEEAKKQQPSIIFFDEIDGLAPVRSSKQEQIHASIVSTLLALMDGMDNRGQVIVIGATNRPDAVDPALRRPGRFDREFYFPLPDDQARAKILSIHTRKWNPPLSNEFIDNLARLTKGYGGADLRALCTEAALFCIQRKFPQIYRSAQKLKVDKNKLQVTTNDFMLALQKIIPSSARSTGSTPEPLPEIVKPLLQDQYEQVKKVLMKIVPEGTNNLQRGKSLIQHYIDYEDVESKNSSLTTHFGKHEFIKQLSEARVCKPKLLITGPHGNGQEYIGAAILNYFEHFNVQNLDIASLLSESSRSIETAIIEGFLEARKRQPSIIYVPNFDIWCKTVPESAVLTLASLLRSLQSNEKILLLCICEFLNKDEIIEQSMNTLGIKNHTFTIKLPSEEQRKSFFQNIGKVLMMKPTEFQVERKRRRPLRELPLAGRETVASNLDENGKLLSPEDLLRRKLKVLQYQDMKLKNVLKIKLSGLMDLFKNRYKRFRKPPIEDSLLVHLFEPQPTDPSWQPAYIKDDGMILEVATGRKFYNMDLDIVEERLWNGYYSEPRQFLKDIELIYIDSNTVGDRERVIKASEMFANAQMGIEDISSQTEFMKECKALRTRELQRAQFALKDLESEVKKQEEMNTDAVENVTNTESNAGLLTESNLEPSTVMAPIEGVVSELTIGAGNQIQAQLQVNDSNLRDSQDIIKTNEIPDNFTSEPLNLQKSIDSEVGILADAVESKVTPIVPISKILDAPITTERSEVKDTAIKTKESFAKENKREEIGDVMDGNPVIGADDSNEIESEGTAEEEEEEEEFIIDEADVTKILNDLQQSTENATVSVLEEIYSGITDIIWEYRLSWDKTVTIQKIMRLLENHS